MAFSKKNKRKITVGENVFYWLYKYQEDSLRLIVMSEEKTHSRLICDFKDKALSQHFRELVKDDESYNDKMLIITPSVLTPWVVRQIIDCGMTHGWKPFTKNKDFIVSGMENLIDFDFRDESTPEDRQSVRQNHYS